MPKRLQSYESEEIVVTFNPNVCIHGGACVRGLPAVFDIKRKHWIRPELTLIYKSAHDLLTFPQFLQMSLHFRHSRALNPQ